jgi:hypothetical protein
MTAQDTTPQTACPRFVGRACNKAVKWWSLALEGPRVFASQDPPSQTSERPITSIEGATEAFTEGGGLPKGGLLSPAVRDVQDPHRTVFSPCRDIFPIIGYARLMTRSCNEPPKERAPLLLVFGDELAGRMAALVRARPILIARLIFCPRQSVHSIAAFLYLAIDAKRPDAEVATIINESDPRDLLRAALPGCPPRLYRALDRAGDRVRQRAFYEKLGSVSRGLFGDALLNGGPLDNDRLSFYESLSNMDPEMASLHAVLPESRYEAEGVDALIKLIRSHGALHDGDLRLPMKAGLPALVRRLRRALDRIPAPDPGFQPTPPFRLITTTAELQQIGKAFGNCVALPEWNAAGHHMRLIDGSGVYLTADVPPMLASLRRVGSGLWLFEQMAGPRNSAPPDGAKAALIRDLRAAGLAIVETDPQSALSRLISHTQRRRDAEDDEPDDEDDDLDDAVEDAA